MKNSQQPKLIPSYAKNRMTSPGKKVQISLTYFCIHIQQQQVYQLSIWYITNLKNPYINITALQQYSVFKYALTVTVTANINENKVLLWLSFTKMYVNRTSIVSLNVYIVIFKFILSVNLKIQRDFELQQCVVILNKRYNYKLKTVSTGALI